MIKLRKSKKTFIIQYDKNPRAPTAYAYYFVNHKYIRAKTAEIGEKMLMLARGMKMERENGEVFDIMNAEDHLAVYEISPKDHQVGIVVKDQFEEHDLKVIRSLFLAVPTEKQDWVAHDE